MENGATLQRKIYFLKVLSEGRSFDEILSAIDELDGDDMYSREEGRDERLFLRSFEQKNDMYRGSIARLRLNGLPSLGQLHARDTRLLQVAEDEGLVETTHFIFFKTSGILAIEYNHYGPRASALDSHLNAKANLLFGEPSNISFQYIFDQEVLQKLDENAEIRMLDIAIPKEKIGNLAAFDRTIHQAFENAAHYGNPGKVELVLRYDGQSNGSPLSARNLIRKLSGLDDGPRAIFSKFKVRAKPSNENVQAFDLLETKLMRSVQVTRTGRGREVVSGEMFGQLQRAYQQQRESLRAVSEFEDVT